MKVFIIESDRNYETMYLRRGWELVYSIEDADLVQFTGGADVTPSLYKEDAHPSTHNDSLRDEHERMCFLECLSLRVPMAGVCRGGQFLNVMNGGKMFQDVDNHAIHGTHTLIDVASAAEIEVTSTHHQMMIPAAEGELVAYADGLSSHKISMSSGGIVEGGRGVDTEVVYYPDSNSLCFQPHPEYGVASCENYYFELLERYLA